MHGADRKLNQRAIICVLGVLAIGLFAIFSIIDVESATPSVYPLDSKPYGVTYPDWTVKWWQWFLAIPQDDHPMNDETGKNCGVNQDNPNVWYLTTTGSGTVVRTCSIPAGKALLVPIAANECSYAEFPNLKSEAELRACAVSGDEVSAIQASIDGVEIKDIRKYRVHNHRSSIQPLLRIMFSEHREALLKQYRMLLSCFYNLYLQANMNSI